MDIGGNKLNTHRFYQMVMAATIATSAIVIAPPAYAASSFPDINPSTEDGKAIINLAERGIISGYPDGTFKPANFITRTQAAKILAGILHLDTVHVTNPNFKDITPDNENYGAIAALAEAGIIRGSNGYFNPTKQITRGQLSKMIVKGFDLTITDDIDIPFTDVKAGSEYEPYIQTLFSNNITKGTTPTTFGPQSYVKRSQLASFVVRAENTQHNATISASRFNQDYIFASYGGIEPAEDIFTWDDEEIMTNTITIKPLKEGTGKLVISGFSEETEEFTDFFFLVHVKTVDGKLQTTLEEVNEEDYLEHLPLNLNETDLTFTPTEVSIQTADGQALSSDSYALETKDNGTTLSIFKDGQYLLTFTNGTQQQIMAADVYTYDFVRSIDLYELTDELTFTSDYFTFEPVQVALEDLDDGSDPTYKVPVKAVLDGNKLIVTPLAEGNAMIHVTGKNGETAYLNVEFMKIAGKWATYYDLYDDMEDY